MAIGDLEGTVYNDAMQRLAGWATDFNGVADPLRRAARVMAAMAHVMAKVLETQTLAMTNITDRMAVVNDVLDAANRSLTLNKDTPETQQFDWVVGSQAQIDLIAAVLRSETDVKETPPGAAYDGWFQVVDNHDGTWKIVTDRRDLTGITDSLQIALQKLGGTQQNDQTRVQTAVGRYNATFELVSSLIKKSETQGDSVGNNLRG